MCPECLDLLATGPKLCNSARNQTVFWFGASNSIIVQRKITKFIKKARINIKYLHKLSRKDISKMRIVHVLITRERVSAVTILIWLLVDII